MPHNPHLNRFLHAQERDYDRALSEIKNGRKTSHWMWYIFPTYKGFGRSERTKYYAIQSTDETKDYLNHPVLGSRLRTISNELLKLETSDPVLIFGPTDARKLKRAMTLFYSIDRNEEGVFMKVLKKFFEGHLDNRTLTLIGSNLREKPEDWICTECEELNFARRKACFKCGYTKT